MFKATLEYKNGKLYFISAGTLKMLEDKCFPFTEDEKVLKIYIEKVESIGYLKHPELGINSLVDKLNHD